MKKKYRLKKNEDFAKIISRKESRVNYSYIVYSAKPKSNPRIGISVSKKLGNAVVRNKIKRQVRMMVIIDKIYDVINKDIIIIVRKEYLNKNFEENKKLLESILKII